MCNLVLERGVDRYGEVIYVKRQKFYYTTKAKYCSYYVLLVKDRNQKMFQGEVLSWAVRNKRYVKEGACGGRHEERVNSRRCKRGRLVETKAGVDRSRERWLERWTEAGLWKAMNGCMLRNRCF